MKKFLLFSLLVGLFGGSQAQDLKPIKLNQPNVKRGLPVMTALQKRQSTREYADKKLELQDLSDLLWAAAGINRPESAGNRCLCVFAGRGLFVSSKSE